jgi:hypothetical protein
MRGTTTQTTEQTTMSDDNDRPTFKQSWQKIIIERCDSGWLIRLLGANDQPLERHGFNYSYDCNQFVLDRVQDAKKSEKPND